MPADAKPLFRLDALRPKLNVFTPAPAVTRARPKLGNWTDLLSSKAAEKMKETELLGDFIRDVFGDLLGYVGPASGSKVYTIKRESLVQVDGKFADAALGRFTLADGQADFVLVIEGKGPRDPLDRPFGSRKRSAVEQALQYAVNLQIDWFLVTNMKEIRLFHKGHDLFTYERFETDVLARDDAALKRFAYLLGADRVVPAGGGTHLDALLADSRRIGRELTVDYYHEYATLRRQTFHELRRANPDISPADLLAVTQKILDRILFIAFSEDRGLLPEKSIANAFRHADPYNPRPIWDNFRGLFRSVDEGNDNLKIAKYNGGLFAADEMLDRLKVPDVVCKGFDKLAAYEYGKDADNPNAKMIDVEILGHIFEQSISDLEELHQQITAPVPAEAEPTKAGPSKRKKEGAFYTPAFVTRYIVAETLQPILADRFETLRRQYEDDAKGAAKKLFADPRAYDLRELTGPQRKALADFWNAWLDTLATVRIVDPACGSGAFLLEAFDQMHAHYQQANARYAELSDSHLFRDVDRQILQSNLFGMDLNTEAIEIGRLSLWIKTAEKGKVLTSLDDNVKQGNSVIVAPTPLDAWKKRFPAAMAEGGFDVVIGNPPYVRDEWFAKDKPFLKQHYRAYDGGADLYVYFYELGMKLLKPGGRLGFIVTNKWMRAGYGEPLRKFFSESAWVEQVVDFGHAKQIFPDADVFPSILVARKGTDWTPLAGRGVVILPDHDAAGAGYAEDVIRLLGQLAPKPSIKIVNLPGLPDAGDAVDFIAYRHAAGLDGAAIRAEIQKLAADAAAAQPKATEPAIAPVLISLADVQPLPVSWLWPGRIALGKVTLLAGDPGLGKSFVTLDIAAKVSCGAPWPDAPGIKTTAGGVVLLSAEDDAEDTIRPRLDAAGANVERIKALLAVRRNYQDDPTRESTFNLETDLPALEAAILAVHGCRLVIIDPITAYLGGTDSHKNAEIRGLIAPLAALAAKHRVAIVCVTHLNKSGNGPAIYRSIGSIAFVAAARAAWAVTKDKDNPRRRLVLPAKNNLAPDALGLAYSLEPYGANGTAVVCWEPDPVTTSADDAMQGDTGKADAEDGNQAQAWLRDALKDGPMPAADVFTQGKTNGFGEKMIRRAFHDLGGKPKKSGFTGGWLWALPSAEDALHPQGESSASWESSQKTKESSPVLRPVKDEDAQDAQDCGDGPRQQSTGADDEWGIVA